MLDWKIRKGALDGQKELHSGTDHQQADGLCVTQDRSLGRAIDYHGKES